MKKPARKKFKLPGTPFEKVLAEAMGKPAWKRKEDSKNQQPQPWEKRAARPNAPEARSNGTEAISPAAVGTAAPLWSRNPAVGFIRLLSPVAPAIPSKAANSGIDSPRLTVLATSLTFSGSIGYGWAVSVPVAFAAALGGVTQSAIQAAFTTELGTNVIAGNNYGGGIQQGGVNVIQSGNLPIQLGIDPTLGATPSDGTWNEALRQYEQIQNSYRI